jgi:hypothetical protein
MCAVPLHRIRNHLYRAHLIEKFLCPLCGKDTKYKKCLVVSERERDQGPMLLF